MELERLGLHGRRGTSGWKWFWTAAGAVAAVVLATQAHDLRRYIRIRNM